MRIKFELNSEDQWYFYKYLIKYNSIIRRDYLTNFILTILVPPFLLFLIYYARIIKSIWEIAFLLIFSEVCMIIWYINYPKRQIMKLVKQDEKLIGSHTLEILSEGIRETRFKKEIFVPWEDIKKVSQDSNSIYIMSSETGGFIIPKRSFNSKAEEQSFLNELLKFTKQEP